MKKAKIFFTALALSAIMSIPTFAVEWKQDNAGWWYQNDDGSYVTNQWIQDFDGKWYYFNELGYMVTNTITADGRILGIDGAWIQPLAGETSAILSDIENWVIGDIWNKGFCDFYHYEEDGTDNTGSVIDINSGH